MLSQTQIKSYWSPRCSGPFATVSLNGSGKVTVDAAIVSAVKALNQVLIAYRYYTRSLDTGAYNCRLNTSGTSYSTHAYGVALDINWLSNPYYRYLRTDMDNYGDGRMPHRICAIRTNNGRQVWNWGGFWSGNKDSMHYEVVCTPADLRTGINWSTVYGGVIVLPPPPPKPPEEGPVYRIHTFKGSVGGQTVSSIYRTLSAKAENDNTWLVVSAWHIKDGAELKVWQDRGLKTVSTTQAVRGSIQYYNGPFDNTKTY